MSDNDSGYAIVKRKLARSEAEKSVLLKALALRADPTSIVKQADLALALDDLDAERNDVASAILKAFGTPAAPATFESVIAGAHQQLTKNRTTSDTEGEASADALALLARLNKTAPPEPKS